MKNIFNKMFNNDSPEDIKNNEQPESINNTDDTPTSEAEMPILEPLSETDRLQNDLAEANEKYIRLYSDFENYKRRTIKERMELIHTANQEMMLAILPIIDDFERAQKSFAAATDIEPIREGVTLIYQKMSSTLQQKGLKPLESIGQPFNSDLHEAITEVPVEDSAKKGTVLDEVERGYMLGEKVIRFAKVVVAG